MSQSRPKELIILELFKDDNITHSTIESLLKHGFDTNESLLTLEYELDFPQMTDICLSQKCFLRKRLTDLRKNYYKSSNSNTNDCSAAIMTEESLESDDNNNTSKEIGIFSESEAIVCSIREQVIRQSNKIRNQNSTEKIIPLEFSFEPIVDHLRESLIKVEKQKLEKDLIINRQETDLKLKGFEIQKLEAKCKQLETQLMCEKLKVEKLEYKMKNIELNISNYNSYDNYLNNFENHIENNYLNHNFSPTLSNICSQFISNLIDSLIQKEANSSKQISDTNLKQFTNNMYSKYQIDEENTNELGDNSSPSNSSDTDQSSSQSEDIVPQRWKTCAERKVYEIDSEEQESEQSSDLSEFNEMVESIVCEPDFNFRHHFTSYKPKSHLRVENNRIVNIVDQNSNYRNVSKNSNQSKQKSCQSSLRQQSSVPSKGFRCYYNNCYLSFVSAEGLKRHIRSVHTKEKPFECHFNDCRKRFGRSDALKEHLKRHMGLKLFKCSYTNCNFKSVSSNSLKRHTFSIHLKEKHFKCLHENCAKTFGRKDSLKKHMEKKHGINNETM